MTPCDFARDPARPGWCRCRRCKNRMRGKDPSRLVAKCRRPDSEPAELVLGLGDVVALGLAWCGLTERRWERFLAWRQRGGLVTGGCFAVLDRSPQPKPRCGCALRRAKLNRWSRRAVTWLNEVGR